MSAAPHTPTASPPGAHAHTGVRSEEDVVPTATIVAVGIVALVIFFVGSCAAVSYLRVRQAERGPVALPPDIGQSKIGLVEQQQFELAVRGQRQRARQLERLGSLGWVDRNAGVAHIPIDEAMRLVVEGVRAGPTTGGAPPTGGQP